MVAARGRQQMHRLRNRHNSKSKGVTDVLVLMDPGQDLDDEMLLIALRGLIDDGLVRCKGIVTTLAPAQMRARLARGTLDELGLSHVPVACGSDGNATGDTKSMEALPYLGPEVELTGQALMTAVLEEAMPHSLAFVVVASLTDARAILEAQPRLFKEKVRLACVMGGVEPFDATTEHLTPDTAHNNVFDKEASRFFYVRCQELGVPLRIVSRFAAYSCPVPRSIYDEMAATGSPIGKHLQQVQAESIERLWRRACAPEGSDERNGLPARCDRAWFCETFCAGKGTERDGSQSIWDLILTFNMYDPIALLSVVPQLQHMFNYTRFMANGVEHTVVGVSKESTGIHPDAGAAEVMRRALMRGIRMDVKATADGGGGSRDCPAEEPKRAGRL